MRNLFVMAVATSIMVLSGCSGVQSIGSLGDTGYQAFDIRAEHGLSPSWSVGVLIAPDGTAMVLAPGTETGLFGKVISAGSSIGSAYLFGHELRPDTYTDSSSTSVTSGASAGAGAAAGAAAGASTHQSQGQAQGQSQTARGGRGGDGGNGGRGGAGGDGGAGGNGPPNNRPPNNRPPNRGHGDD